MNDIIVFENLCCCPSTLNDNPAFSICTPETVFLNLLLWSPKLKSRLHADGPNTYGTSFLIRGVIVYMYVPVNIH